ncbi:MAG: gliding motility-associated C-terminal domain-containing protein [Muribaculaceae bacterium]|nr:gliding motility-associated C-terminal domain-containing protein [Muribaculaceae bacterium]
MPNISRNISRSLLGLFCSIYSLSFVAADAAELTFTGNTLPVLQDVPEKVTGLDKIYVIYDMNNVDMIYTSSNPNNIKIFRYSNLGGGFAEEVTNLDRTSDSVILHSPEGNMGYIIEESNADASLIKRYYYWVVNYLPYRLSLNSIGRSAESDCDATFLTVEGSGDPIHYYTINGQQRTLDREISVKFSTQEWNVTNNDFQTIETVKYFDSLSNPLRITPPPYCSTSFYISGDKFLRKWDWIEEAESNVYAPISVLAETEALQEEDSADEDGDNSSTSGSNQINSNTDGLGGSAPASISFIAHATEGVLHHEWQLASDPEFENVDFRFNQQDIDYIFNHEGTYYMRYIGSNSDGSCETIGDIYTINIGASDLKCPNAFSPDGDGVNDEWKVSYRSLLSFKCWIFDRFGNQLYYFEDPAGGWDGKHRGKTVSSGVYYYVIQAEGADGKKYKKSGDINILRHRAAPSSGDSSGNSTTN